MITIYIVTANESYRVKEQRCHLDYAAAAGSYRHLCTIYGEASVCLASVQLPWPGLRALLTEWAGQLRQWSKGLPVSALQRLRRERVGRAGLNSEPPGWRDH